MIKKLKPFGLCESCGRYKATQLHEKFPATKSNLKLYGDLLFERINTQYVCENCNGSHAGVGRGLIIWTEIEFCEASNIEPRSKTAQQKKRFQ